MSAAPVAGRRGAGAPVAWAFAAGAPVAWALAAGTRCKNYFYQVNINPRADEHLTPKQRDEAVDRLESNLGLTGQQWIVLSYSLALAALYLVGGAVGDRYGRRPTFIAGAAGFAVASVFA